MKGRQVAINVLLFACAVVFGVLLSLKPWRVYSQQRRQTELAVATMKAAQRKHAEEIKELSSITGSVGRQRLAMQQGFHPAGEVPQQP